MIARKITYYGTFNQDIVGQMYDIARKTEITGEVRPVSGQEVELSLEGDPAVIKLIQHQIDREAKACIKEKVVSQIPFKYYKGITLLS